MSSVLYIILAILILSILIVLHELGHYLVGKAFGFGIMEFSIGMGPVLFRVRGKETDFTLRAFPIGGSCRFFEETGTDPDGESDEQPKEPRFPPERSFNAQKVWKRLLVIVAGPLMNVMTALVLAFVLLLSFGATVDAGKEQIVQVTEVEADTAAARAGVQAGDILLSVDGKTFSDYAGFSEAFSAVRANEVDLVVLRGAEIKTEETKNGDSTTYVTTESGGEQISLHATDIRDKHTGNNRLGVSLALLTRSYYEQRYNVLTAAGASFPYCWNMIRQVYGALFDLFTGKACINQMSGVIGTVSIMSDTMQTASAYGVGDVIYVILLLGALISVNFAVVNLLPIPALDGGRLVFIVIEIIRGKPIPPEKEGIVHFIGMILLLVLIAVMMVSDLINCFRG